MIKTNVATRINSRRKGATFECQVAKAIAAWWGCAVRRTPLSGGWGAAITAGDTILLPPEKDDPEFETKFRRYRDWPFSVECKHHKDFTIDALFTSPEKSPLGKFISQCKRAASKEKRMPLLVAKKNYGEAFAFLISDKRIDFEVEPVGVITLAAMSGSCTCFVHVLPFAVLTSIAPDDLLRLLSA